MRAFWRFARRMTRHRALLVGAALGALVSAGGLGAGLIAVAPVLRNILGTSPRLLPDLARDADAWLRANVGVGAPAGWIESLPTDRFSAVLWIVVGLGLLTFVGAAANFLHQYWSMHLAHRAAAEVRRDAFHRALHMPLGAAVASGAAEVTSRIVSDSTRLAAGFLVLVDKGPAQVTKGLIAFLAAVWIDWRSLAAVPVGLLLGVIIRKLGKVVRRASRGAMAAQARLLSVTTESLQGLRAVKVSNAERYEVGRFSLANRAFLAETLRARTARALASPLLECLAIIVLGAWSLVFAKQIIDGNLDPGNFLASLVALAVAAASLKPLSAMVQEIQGTAPAADRLAELIDAEAEASARGSAGPAPRLPRHARSIEWENVTLRYPGAERPALRGVSLRVAHGETVAFVGGNGSGKTTLLSLPPRLLEPQSGRTLIDGVDVRGVHLRSLRRQFGVVTQEVAMFDGTIAANIAYGCEGATPAKIEAAARLARAHEFIAARAGAYAAPVGERGLALSGGQRQRIAIARAFLRDPAILILDEATSMIDAESEALIAAAVSEFSRGRTTLIIAHRLSTVVHADRIVVMDEGAIVDVGRHDALLERCEVYRSLTASQLIATPA